MPRKSSDHLTDRERADHMLLAARDARNFAAGRTRHDLDTDRMLLRALVHCVQEIGEAAARMSEEGRARIPTLPWAKIVGMRHILVHVYHDLDHDAVWGVVSGHLATMITSLEEALAHWPA